MRVFFVGFLADQDQLWRSPASTSSSDALLLSQWASSEYWELHKLATWERPPRPVAVDKKIQMLVATNYGVTWWQQPGSDTCKIFICDRRPLRRE
jgi:DNA (cytosine-5)-methyltransferase 1